GEIGDLDPPDGLHAQLGILQDLHLADAVLGQPGCRAADRAEVETAVPLAGLGDLPRPVALGEHHQRAAGRLELLDVRVHPARCGRPERARRVPVRGLRRPGVVDGVLTQVLRHRLTGVEPLGDLRVGDVAGDHERSGQRQPGLYRVPGQLRPDVRHRPVEIDVHDLTAFDAAFDLDVR